MLLNQQHKVMNGERTETGKNDIQQTATIKLKTATSNAIITVSISSYLAPKHLNTGSTTNIVITDTGRPLTCKRQRSAKWSGKSEGEP